MVPNFRQQKLQNNVYFLRQTFKGSKTRQVFKIYIYLQLFSVVIAT